MAELTSTLPPGALLDNDRYQVVRILGRGSFGTTYEATDVKLGRSVAIKEVLSQGLDRARDRFLEEACALARFTHPGIVRVHDVFEDAGGAYVVMELVRGRPLSTLLAERGGALPVDEALRLVRQAGEALAVVHAAGMLHRDVKPANVVAADDGRVVLLDFGAARDVVALEQGMTLQLLTHGYAPVEQYTPSGRVGPAADVYALAATAYHLLSGSRPPSAPDRLRGAPVVPLAEVAPHVPAGVAGAVGWGLALQPEDRPQSVRELLQALDGSSMAPLTDDPTVAVDRTVVVDETVDVTAARDLEHAPLRASRRVVLPVAIGLGAACAIAPIVVGLAWVLGVLPVVNAVAATRVALGMRRELRGRRWWDGVSLPLTLALRWVWSLVVAVFRTTVVVVVVAMFAAVGIVTADLEATTIGDALRAPAGRAGLGVAGGLLLAIVVPTLLRSSDAYVNHLPRLVRVPNGWRLPAWLLAALAVLAAVVLPLALFPVDRIVRGL